ncbi:alpha-S2-casein-like B [Meriones unguiculatus]|uniref:alpha-S2-casein-like B n=1 Tax=Meriones unguiculatus TaxID=10047 RepID=UPI00293E9D97|nr:alpha-S2-casein-like B [Meriones unguiculatus]
MKFFIFTCLLAVALAKQESMDISQENFKKDVDVVVFPREETVKNIHIPQMESAEAPMKNKCYQTIQKLQTPQALKALYQHHVARNPWGNTVNRAFPSTRTLQYNQNMMDMSMKVRENMMAEEEKNMQDYMNKMKQYSKITWPQFVKLLRQYQKTMHGRSYYPYTPSMV